MILQKNVNMTRNRFLQKENLSASRGCAIFYGCVETGGLTAERALWAGRKSKWCNRVIWWRGRGDLVAGPRAQRALRRSQLQSLCLILRAQVWAGEEDLARPILLMASQEVKAELHNLVALTLACRGLVEESERASPPSQGPSQ